MHITIYLTFFISTNLPIYLFIPILQVNHKAPVSAYPRLYLSFYIKAIHLSNFYYFLLPFYFSFYLSSYINISLYLSLYLSFYLSIYFSFYLSNYLSTYLSIFLSSYLSVFFHQSIYNLHICKDLSINLSN